MLNFRRWLRCFRPVIYGFPFLRPPSTAFCFVPAFVQPSLCLVSLRATVLAASSLPPHRQRARAFLGTPPSAGVTWKRAAQRWVTFLEPLPPGSELGHHAGVPGAAPAARTPPALLRLASRLGLCLRTWSCSDSPWAGRGAPNVPLVALGGLWDCVGGILGGWDKLWGDSWGGVGLDALPPFHVPSSSSPSPQP